MVAFPSRCRWLSRGVILLTGLLGSAAVSAQAFDIQFELLEPSAAAVPVGNSVIIGSLLGIVAAVFLLRRRAVPVGGLAVLVVALGGLLGGAGVHKAGAVLLNPFITMDVGLALQKGETPAEAFKSLKGQVLTIQPQCPRGVATSLSNPFVGKAGGEVAEEAILAAIRLKSVSFVGCPSADPDASTCRTGTVLQPGESCTIAVSEQQLGN